MLPIVAQNEDSLSTGYGMTDSVMGGGTAGPLGPIPIVSKTCTTSMSDSDNKEQPALIVRNGLSVRPKWLQECISQSQKLQ